MMENIVLGCWRFKNFVKSELVLIEFDLGFGVGKNTLLLGDGFYPNKDLNRIFAWIWVHLGLFW